METIFAPNRMEYLKSEKVEGCVFCKTESRDDSLVLFEGNTCYITMNKYPYTSGHVMIIPFRHISDLCELTDEEAAESMSLTKNAMEALKKVFKPEGFNVGMNLGKAAGAGVDSHLHIHVVPRWIGDTNFSTVVGEFRVIPENLAKTREKLISFFQESKEE